MLQSCVVSFVTILLHSRSVSELREPCDKSDTFVKLVASCQRDKLFQIAVNSVQAVRTQFFGLLLFDQRKMVFSLF